MTNKKKKKKLSVKGLILILLITYLLIMFFVYLFNMKIKAVIINGNNILTNEDIKKIVSLKKDEKFLSLNTFKIKNKLVKNKLIKDVTVKKSLKGAITINIEEEKVLFYNKPNDVYVLGNGETIPYNNNILGIPTLINYVPDNIYKELIKKSIKIDDDINKNISEIEYSPDQKEDIVFDENRFILKMNDGNTVYINIANYLKLNNYKKLYQATISKDEIKKGIFYLDSIRDDAILFTDYNALKKGEEGEQIELSQ